MAGGFPCQPFSVAGKQRGNQDDRNLWPEMLRVIKQARPPWVICENVTGHIRLGLDRVLLDLESESYTTRTFIIPALAVGANHNRERVWIVAYSPGNGRNGSKVAIGNGSSVCRGSKRSNTNSHNEGCGCIWVSEKDQNGKAGYRGAEPPTLRVDDGLPNRMDRNRALGNSIHPEIAYKLFMAMELTNPVTHIT